MTINTNNKEKGQAMKSGSEYQTAENNTSIKSTKNVSYRVKPNRKRSYLHGQRCSSGNIANRSKVANLAKENSFLNKCTYSHL